jgi:hypothetical protein
MWFRWALSFLKLGSGHSPACRPKARQCRRVHRPRLEILEDRTLPSTYVVNSLTDTGAGSGLAGDLRYCATNATSGNDTIDFGVSGAIKLESALPALNASVAIQGPGANQLTVERDPSSTSDFRIFSVGSAATVQIAVLTIANGYSDSPGGGIYNAGTLTVSDCTLSNNWAVSSVGVAEGGGLYVASGSVSVARSTFANNEALGASAVGRAYPGLGGGIYVASGTLVVDSSTLSGNSAVGGDGITTDQNGICEGGDGLGGGIYVAGGTASVSNSTIAGNQTVGGVPYVWGDGNNVGYGYGGGLAIGLGYTGTVAVASCTIANNSASWDSGQAVYVGGGTFQPRDSIIASSTAYTGDPDVYCDYGSVASLGHNLIGNSGGGGTFAASDLLDVNPRLGLLQNNGGPTQTMALLPDSPALDAGDNAGAPAFDQRGPGFSRIMNGAIDIGAFEVQTRFAVAGFPAVTTAGVAGNFTVTALNADGSINTGYTGAVRFTSSDPRAVLPADYTFTTADQGTHTFTASLETATGTPGGSSISVMDTGASALTGFQAGIVVDPAAAARFQVGGFPSAVSVGYSGNLTVTAYDPYGNVVGGYAGTVHFTSSDGQAVLPADYAFTASDHGTKPFSATMKTAGSQSITATDTGNPGLTGSQAGIRVNPVASISGPAAGALNQTLTFTLNASGDPAGTVFTFSIDWNGDGIVDQTVTGPSGTTISHSYATSGAQNIRLTATDPGGFTGTVAIQSVNILPVSVTVQTDPASTTRQMLTIDGTANSDRIVLGAGTDNGVTLSFDGTALGNILPTNGGSFALVIVLGEGGSDTLDTRSLSVSSVLVGGSGNDTLYGGSAPNLLIGGLGADTLYAGNAGDILIGGATSYDSNLTALAVIMAEWDRTDVSYSTRIKHLQGSLGGGLNGQYVLNGSTVLDDNTTDALYGGAGLDWYFAHQKGKKDLVYGPTSGEVVTSI